MLDFEIFTSVTIDVNFRVLLVDLRTVVHEDLANDVGTVQSDLHIVRIVQ